MAYWSRSKLTENSTPVGLRDQNIGGHARIKVGKVASPRLDVQRAIPASKSASDVSVKFPPAQWPCRRDILPSAAAGRARWREVRCRGFTLRSSISRRGRARSERRDIVSRELACPAVERARASVKSLFSRFRYVIFSSPPSKACGAPRLYYSETALSLIFSCLFQDDRRQTIDTVLWYSVATAPDMKRRRSPRSRTDSRCYHHSSAMKVARRLRKSQRTGHQKVK